MKLKLFKNEFFPILKTPLNKEQYEYSLKKISGLITMYKRKISTLGFKISDEYQKSITLERPILVKEMKQDLDNLSESLNELYELRMKIWSKSLEESDLIKLNNFLQIRTWNILEIAALLVVTTVAIYYIVSYIF